MIGVGESARSAAAAIRPSILEGLFVDEHGAEFSAEDLADTEAWIRGEITMDEALRRALARIHGDQKN